MLKIFVSSTFHDMHMERDCLEDIEQDINARLLETGERIEFIDLRWGICTEELDQEAENKAVLEGCFSAIDKSDYLLVFLGNRYGTIKKYDDVIGYLGKKKTDVLFKDNETGKSITELEVSYAQLIRGFDATNTLVCAKESSEIETLAKQFADSFTENDTYAESIIKYSSLEKETLKAKLKEQLSQLVKEHIENTTRFDRDYKRLCNISLEAILNSRLSTYKLEHQTLIFSGEKGIGKTITAAEILRRNHHANTLYFATWETAEKKLTYEQFLYLLGNAFAEWFKEEMNDKNLKEYLKNSISKITELGYKFVLFLDSADHILHINYLEILDILGDNQLIITTNDATKILSSIPLYKNYKIFNDKDIHFTKDEIADVIKNEFQEHGKSIRSETLDILCNKRDIIKPLYLHFAIKRLLFLKGKDFAKCGPNESPEKNVLMDIAKEMPPSLSELLTYSIKNICDNSDIETEMQMAIGLIANSYGGITDEILIKYFIYNHVCPDKETALPYIYEIKNRLDDFIEYDGMWLQRKYGTEIYLSIYKEDDINKFVESNKKDYKNEYFIREYLYQNRNQAEKLYSFLSARVLWKRENKPIRSIYRKYFWNLVENGCLTVNILDENFFVRILDMYENNDSFPICCKDFIFKLLTENLENEVFNFESGDGVVILFRLIEIHLAELCTTYNMGILISLDDIPIETLNLFGNLAFLYKTFSKSLLNMRSSNWDLSGLYYSLLTSTLDYAGLINSLSCAEMLIGSEDNRSVLYYHNAVRLVSAVNFFVHLGSYDSRYSSDEEIYNNGIYFNWRYKNDQVFDTAKYSILYFLSKWVEEFDTKESQFAMDIVSIDYYINYVSRSNLMGNYNDAILLILLLAYEIYKINHFRTYDASVEGYWIQNYPYTRLDCCPFYRQEDDTDFELRTTVLSTIHELKKAISKAIHDTCIGLKEKCTLDILKITIVDIIIHAQINEDCKQIIVSELIYDDDFTDYKTLKKTLENPDLADYLPLEYLAFHNQNEAIIQQATKELNFHCI